jgi:transposase-like protein
MTETRTETHSEVVAGLVVGHKRDGRCIYSREGKRALVQLSLKRGASVARVAQQHGVNANLLRKWIDAFQGRGRPVNRHAVSPTVPKLLPIVEIASPPVVRQSAISRPRADPSAESLDCGFIEVEIRGVKVRLHGEVSARALEVVLGVVSRRP